MAKQESIPTNEDLRAQAEAIAAKQRELDERELTILALEEKAGIHARPSAGRRLWKGYLTAPNIADGKNYGGLLCGGVFFPNPTKDGRGVPVYFYADPAKPMPKHDYYPVGPQVDKATGVVSVKQQHVTGQSAPNAYDQIDAEIRINGPTPATEAEALSHGGILGDADEGRILGEYKRIGVHTANDTRPQVF